VNYRLHPEARKDLREAADFYREHADVALSQALLAEFERCVTLLLRHPDFGSKWRYGKRRLLMRRFPYGVVYDVVGDELRILAVAHHSRRPGYWRGRR
jgi:plasmid stabilization system protein ParE